MNWQDLYYGECRRLLTERETKNNITRKICGANEKQSTGIDLPQQTAVIETEESTMI